MMPDALTELETPVRLSSASPSDRPATVASRLQRPSRPASDVSSRSSAVSPAASSASTAARIASRSPVAQASTARSSSRSSRSASSSWKTGRWKTKALSRAVKSSPTVAKARAKPFPAHGSPKSSSSRNPPAASAGGVSWNASSSSTRRRVASLRPRRWCWKLEMRQASKHSSSATRAIAPRQRRAADGRVGASAAAAIKAGFGCTAAIDALRVGCARLSRVKRSPNLSWRHRRPAVDRGQRCETALGT
mmetsp:Transcript_9379/g.28093  ORF Transcript_9379/g.28093 Transcript_9379/m.28093 type:complete len:249 (+) Transcript_9379:423-1169(+)